MYKVARDELGLDDKTICDWASFARKVAVAWSIRQDEKIGGPGQIVEIDEPNLGKENMMLKE